MVQVGVTHGGVLAHDVHAPHLVRVAVIGQGLVHDFHHGVARLGVQRLSPKNFQTISKLGDRIALVVGQHHGDEARIAGPLHIVLATQGVQAGAGPANLSGDAGQCNQAAHVVGAVHVLAHAHAPQHHRGRRVGKGVGHFAQGGHIDATNGRHALGGEGLHMQSQGFKVAGALAHKGLVRPSPR
jgi:hypothetical protein